MNQKKKKNVTCNMNYKLKRYISTITKFSINRFSKKKKKSLVLITSL